MKKEKKICLRIDTHRIANSILVVASLVNLMIVGVVFAAASPPPAPTLAITPTDLVSSSPSILPPVIIFTATQIPSNTPTYTFTPTETPSPTPTYTSTPTDTATPSPSPLPCVPQFSWPVYIVQPDDTLFSVAFATGSTIDGLMLANCLPNSWIYAGEWLFVPRLPTKISTPTFTPTPTSASWACAEFEDLKPGMVFKTGESFVSSNLGVTIGPFVWSNGNSTNDGLAHVADRQMARGFGRELQVNNVNLFFNLPTSPSSLSLLFGEYGGNLNITINGDFRNFDNFTDINHFDMGGVKISVLQGFGNDAGFLQLSGAIKFFAIGGQELWIDNVCLSR